MDCFKDWRRWNLTEKSYITMEQKICPICGKEQPTNALLLDKRLKPKFDTYTTTGYGLCKNCDKKNKEGYLALVVCDPEKSKPTGKTMKLEDAYRTGELIHIKREVAKKIFNIDVERELMFIDIEAANKIKGMVEK